MKALPSRILALAVLTCMLGAAVPAMADGRNPDRYAPSSFWQGLYAGAHVGLGDADGGLDGAVVGGQIGYNWQRGLMVYGWEVDATWSDMSADVRFGGITIAEFSIDWMASVRGRLGYLVQPNILAYGTAGLGMVHGSGEVPLLGFEGGDTNTEVVIGFGIEMKWNETTSVRAEYLSFTDSEIDVLRAGINFKLPGY